MFALGRISRLAMHIGQAVTTQLAPASFAAAINLSHRLVTMGVLLTDSEPPQQSVL